MKKVGTTIMIAIFLMAGCSGTSSEISTSSVPANLPSVISMEEVSDPLPLTHKEMLEDFDFMVQTLRESYPFWGVVERTKVDPEQYLKDYRELIATSCESDREFYDIMKTFFSYFDGIGHLRLVDIEEYRTLYNPINAQIKSSSGSPYDEALNSAVKDAYLYYADLYKIHFFQPNIQGESQLDIAVHEPESLRILEDGKTAVIEFPTFLLTNLTNEEKTVELIELYQKISDYEDIIFDITKNGGGYSSYWMDGIVRPNIDQTLEWDLYFTAKNSDYNRIRWNMIDWIRELQESGEGFQIIDTLPHLPQFQDRDKMDVWMMPHRSISPSEEQKQLEGRFWVLTSQHVYSAAEEFAVFCKATGFATLVGTVTGGDGIGFAPFYITLPNSHLLVKYSSILGLNPDGSANEEFGTTPDILSPEGESPLDTCLREIEKIRQGG